ncbi:hypothetical protein Tco_0916737 [Tanacetum coccineum]
MLLHGMKLKRKWEPGNQKLVQIRQRGKERCHVEADHALAFDQSFLGSLTCLHIAFAACICTLHLYIAFAACICKQAFAHCTCTLHLQAKVLIKTLLKVKQVENKQREKKPRFNKQFL